MGLDHRHRAAESMRSWSDAITLTDDDITEAARRPVERHLRGFDGELWSLTLEIPRSGNHDGYDLTFRRGPQIVTRPVAQDYALGDESPFDLMHYLKTQLCKAQH